MPKFVMQSCFLWLLLIQHLYAQNPEEVSISGQYQNTPFITFIEQVETRHAVRFFFVTEWVQPIKVNGTFNQTPLTQVLTNTLQGTDISFIVYEPAYIILMKSPGAIQAARRTQSADQDVIIVGDSLHTNGQPAKLSGYIRDGSTGEVIIGAGIFAEDLQQGTSTNLNGYYSFSLPAGIHHLRINSVGYEAEQKDIKILSDGTFSMDLYESTARLEEVVITDKAEDANFASSQMSAVRLDIQSVKKLPAFLGEVDLINSIELLPGVSVAGEASSGFNVRGGDSGQNLVLLDGIPIFNPSHLFGFFSAFNSDLLQGATLYKGGIPAQYGGRISSVLDVDLKEANLRKVQGTGGIGLVSSRLTLEVPLVKDKSSLLLGGRTTYSDWILRGIKDINLKKSEASFYDVNARFNYRFNEKHKLTLSAYKSHDNFVYAGENGYGYGNEGLAVQWNYLISPKFLSELKATYSGFAYEVSSREDSLKNQRLTSGFSTTQAQLSFTYFPSDHHQLDLGVNVTGYHFSPGKLEPWGENSLIHPETLEKEQSTELSLYFNDEFTISRNITLNYGLRYNWYANLGPGTDYRYEAGFAKSINSITDTVAYSSGETIASYQGPEPRISLKIGITGRSSVKVSYNRLRQNLHLISNTTSITPTDIWKLSDRYIQPQIGDQIALGYFRNSIGNAIESSVEVYYKDINNLVEYKNGAQLLMNQQLETDLLNGLGRAYGVELFIAKNIGRLTGWLSYTYSRSLRKVESEYREERINLGKFYPSAFDKPHDLTVVANYQFTRRVRLGANFTLNSGRPITLPEGSYSLGNYTIPNYSERNQYRIPAYHRLDVSFSIDGNLKKKKMWDSSWTFSIYNVYGRKNPYSIFFKNDQGAQLSAYQLAVLGRPFPSVSYNFKF